MKTTKRRKCQKQESFPEFCKKNKVGETFNSLTEINLAKSDVSKKETDFLSEDSDGTWPLVFTATGRKIDLTY